MNYTTTILGDWKDKEVAKAAHTYEQTRDEIVAGLSQNRLLMTVGIDDGGTEVQIPIGRFLAKDIYERGLSKQEIDELLAEFLPKVEPSAVKMIYGAEAARKLASGALSAQLDPRQLAAGEGVRGRDATDN